MKISDLTQEDLDQLILKKAIWRNRFLQLWNNLLPQKKNITFWWPRTIISLLEEWAKEAEEELKAND